MITGDNEQTAIAIAKEAGILPEDWKPSPNDYSVMTGKRFREFVGGLVKKEDEDAKVGNMENFKIVADQLKVLARSSPSDK
jgi:Ca2+ transporting ATPase